VLGIDLYEHVPQLRTAVQDATCLAHVLEAKHGYRVELVTTDVTRRHLEDWLETRFEKVEPGSQLFLYFAGHGCAEDSDQGPLGYLIPQDGRPDNFSSFLPMSWLHERLLELPCAHMLAVLDCCFAGAFRWASTRQLSAVPDDCLHRERYDRFVGSPAWQVLTSTSFNQKSRDSFSRLFGVRTNQSSLHSPFAAAFLDGLLGEACQRQIRLKDGRLVPDGVITATDLYQFVKDRVAPLIEYDGIRQVPTLWPLSRHDAGEYVFLKPGFDLERLLPAPRLDEQANPYLGLRPYSSDQADLFFGRQTQTAALHRRVEQEGAPLTAVVGASGTGKSSLVMAGLLPRLEGDRRWDILGLLRPGRAPLLVLVGVLQSRLLRDGVSWTEARLTHRDALANVVGTCLGGDPQRRVLLVIDQFEELQTESPAAQTEQFLLLLADALRRYPQQFRVVLTVLSDYERRFADSGPLKDFWGNGSFTLPPMSVEELREAITGAAAHRVLFFDPPELVDRLVGEFFQSPGALPLLSFTLSQLYLACLKDGNRTLRQSDLVHLGGVRGALSTQANAIHDGLPEDERRTLRRLMLRMVDVEGLEPTRRRVPETEVFYSDPAETARALRVVDLFLQKRLIVEAMMLVGGRPVRCFEPAHDALVRGWDRLAEWVEQAQRQEAVLPLLPHLTRAANDWVQRGQAQQLLWHNHPQLDQARQILAVSEPWLNQAETAFVQQSVALRQQLQRRWWRIAIGVMASLSLLAGIAWLQRNQAEWQRDLAERQSRTNLARRLAVQSRLAQEQYPQRSLLLGSDAVNATWRHGEPPVPPAEQALREALARSGGRALPGHQGEIYAIDMSEDGRYLATGSTDRTVRLWDLHGPGKHRILRHRDVVDFVQMSRDGRRLVTGSRDGLVQVWDLWKSHKVPIFRYRNSRSLMVVALSANGRRLAIADRAIIRVWDLKDSTDAPVCLCSSNAQIRFLVLSRDGRRLVGAGMTRLAEVWDLDGQDRFPIALQLKEFTRGDAGHINALVMSADGRRVAMGISSGSRIWVWTIANGCASYQVLEPGETGGTRLAVISPDGCRLVTHSLGSARTIRVWNLREPVHSKTIPAEQFAPLGAMSLSGNGRWLIVTGSDNTGKLWDLDELDQPRILRGFEDGAGPIAISGDGQRSAIGGVDRMVRVWERDVPIASPIILRCPLILGKHGFRHFVAIRPDGGRLLMGSWEDGSSRTWNLNGFSRTAFDRVQQHAAHRNGVQTSPNGRLLFEGKKVWNIEFPDSQPVELDQKVEFRVSTISADGQWLITGGRDGVARVWRLCALTSPPASSRLPPAFTIAAHKVPIQDVKVSLDGRWLVTVGEDWTVRVWNLNGNDPARQFPPLQHTQSILTAVISPNGHRVVVYSNSDRSAHVWDVSDPRFPRRITILRHEELGFRGLAISPDGRRLATGRVLWNLEDLNAEPVVLPRAMPTTDGNVQKVMFSVDNHWLVAICADRYVCLWDLRPGKLIELARITAGRNLSEPEWQQFYPGEEYHKTFPDLPAGQGVSVRTSAVSRQPSLVIPLIAVGFNIVLLCLLGRRTCHRVTTSADS
jgi:WD40 repeat protein